MIPSLQEIAKNVFKEELDKALLQFAEYQKELPNLENVITDQEFPLTPRLFLSKAMETYTLGQFYASVLLAGTAVDIGLRVFLQQQLGKYVAEQKPKSIVSHLVEEFDFRKAMTVCEKFELFGNKKEKIYGMLHRCFDIRNKYSHGDLTKILGKTADEPIVTTDEEGKRVELASIGDDEFFRNVYVEALVAHKDASELIGLVGDSFDIIRRSRL